MNEARKSNARPLSTNGHNGHAERNGDMPAGVEVESLASLSPAQELISLVLAITRHLLVIDDSAADLPLRQLRVCMLLHESPRSMSWLSRELGVSLSAMTQIADRLERARLVKRQFEGADRRVRSLQLTARGLKIMQAREAARVDRARMAFAQMSQSARESVLNALEKLSGACNDSAPVNDSHAVGAHNGDPSLAIVTKPQRNGFPR